MKQTIGAIAFAAALAFGVALASTPAVAASNDRTNASTGAETNHAAAATDMSARRRHWRRYHVVRPFPHVYPYRYGYYRPRPIIYPYRYGYYRPRPIIYPYSYGYYRPRPIYYRPYYPPAPFFSIGFGPRYYW